MRFLCVYRFISFLFLIESSGVLAADIAVKVVDGLGRPLGDVVVDVHWLEAYSDNDVQTNHLAMLVSDSDGMVRGTYDEKSIPPGEEASLEFTKKGYSGYSTHNYTSEYVMQKQFYAVDVRHIASLTGATQVNALRELLAGEFEPERFVDGPGEWIFVQEHLFRAALLSLIGDPKVGIAASKILALIGVPEDVRIIVNTPPKPDADAKFFSTSNRWAYKVVSALLEPATEEEWDFLRRYALNEYDDRGAEEDAIEALRLMASPESRQLLGEIKDGNKDRAELIEKAIQYIDSTPQPLSDKNLAAAGKKVARAIKVGRWKGNQKPHFNEKGDKALMDIEFINGSVYTATFHKVDGIWKLRGVRETRHALLM